MSIKFYWIIGTQFFYSYIVIQIVFICLEKRGEEKDKKLIVCIPRYINLCLLELFIYLKKICFLFVLCMQFDWFIIIFFPPFSLFFLFICIIYVSYMLHSPHICFSYYFGRLGCSINQFFYYFILLNLKQNLQCKFIDFFKLNLPQVEPLQ